MNRVLLLLALALETALPAAAILSLWLPKRPPDPPSWWKRLLFALGLYAAMTVMAWFGMLAKDRPYRVWDWRDLVFFPFSMAAEFCQVNIILGGLFLAFSALLVALPFVLSGRHPGMRVPHWLPWGLLTVFSFWSLPFALVGWGLRKHIRRWLPWILFGVFLLHLNGCAWTMRSM